MKFEWDLRKARSNLAKHKVSFDEASTVFSDPLSVTFGDPDHSEDEDRFIIGTSSNDRLLIVSHTDRVSACGSLALVRQHGVNENYMNKELETDLNDELRPEYDATTLKNGVRGKYVDRYRKGSNIVVLAPDVAEAFPNAEAVNEALRLLMKVAKTTVSTTA